MLTMIRVVCVCVCPPVSLTCLSAHSSSHSVPLHFSANSSVCAEHDGFPPGDAEHGRLGLYLKVFAACAQLPLSSHVLPSSFQAVI